ncbi:hypothetical protein AAC387_Pa07g3044 [Persea americana]
MEGGFQDSLLGDHVREANGLQYVLKTSQQKVFVKMTKESKQSTKTRKKSLHYPFIPQKSISQIQKDTCKSSKLFYLWQRSRRTRSEIGSNAYLK